MEYGMNYIQLSYKLLIDTELAQSSVSFELKLYFYLTLWFFSFPFEGPGRRFRSCQRCQC